MSKIIATDLDGTLFYPKKRFALISKANKKFLQEFKAEGNRVCAVSGRTSYLSKKLEKKLGFPIDVIACNGSYIKVDGQVIRDHPFDCKRVKQLLEEIYRDYKIGSIMMMTERRNFVIDRSRTNWIVTAIYGIWQWSQGAYSEPYDFSTEKFNQELVDGKIYKILLFIGASKKNQKRAKEMNKKLRESYKDFEFSWSNEIIEISPAGCSKAEGIAYYLNYINSKESDVLVVGDSGNDISMFLSFPENSFCMKHAPKSVKKYAKHIIKRVSNVKSYLKEGY